MFERADVKRAVYAQIDGIAGPALIVGSSSSGIPCSTFTEGLHIGPRCLIAHPINPPYVIPWWRWCRRPGPPRKASPAAGR